jgi:electron transport complex protein RnfA
MNFLTSLLATAFIENTVLSTGFGSSVLLRMSKTRTKIVPFSVLLCLFSLLTVLVCYPLDNLMGTGELAKWLRPLMMVIVAAFWYVLFVLVLKKKFPSRYERVSRMLPLAAFNNLVIGLALIINHRFAVPSLFDALGLSLGSCAGYLILSWLTAEGMERLDNPDVPKAFRGLPAVFIYLGILALALMGFSSDFSLI